jgi:3-hydroxyisobutyrate dehydrogenase
MKIGFIGLGVMGSPMAGHLAAAGHEVAVFNRTSAKALAWAKAHPGETASSVAEAARGRDLIALCVGNDDDVRGVVGEALTTAAAGTIFVDHTTTSAVLAGRWPPGPPSTAASSSTPRSPAARPGRKRASSR